MRRLVQAIAFAAWVGVPVSFDPALAAQAGECWKSGLEHLRASAPDGYAIYRQVGDPSFFKGMIRCDESQYDLSTAVHESTHLITSDEDAFPLIGGGTVGLPHEVSSFYPPMRIASRFKPDDFTTIYLRLGQASSATDFLYLLDELNAYSHDLNAAIDLKDLVTAGESVDHRDGLAALMAFVAVYAERAKESEPTTWRGLQEPRAARAIATLWGQAERVMAASCGIPDFGTEDKGYIRQYCSARARDALAPILGRAPTCPTACLEPTVEPTRETADDAEDAPRREAGVPAWFAKFMRAKNASIGSAPVEDAEHE